MKLYLVRHGEALSSLTDPQRPLSKVGCEQVHCVTHRLLEEEAKPAHIYHSGILRAQQTAEIIAKTLQIITVEKIVNFLPEDSIEPMLQQIATWEKDTLLVGHLPYLSYLLHALCSENYEIVFETATVVCLEKRLNNWQIEAILNP